MIPARTVKLRTLTRAFALTAIAMVWAVLFLVVGLFVFAYGMYADLKAPTTSHWTSGTWAEEVVQYLDLTHFGPLWSAQPDCTDFDEQLIYVPKPGAARFHGPEFDTVIHMTPSRVRAQPPAKPHAPFIVMTGDSYMMGWGVEDNETVSYLLQQDYGYHTVNTGAASYGTARELTRLRRMGLLTHIDALVIQFCDNDLGENETFLKNPAQFYEERDPRREWALLHEFTQQKLTYWNVLGDFGRIVWDQLRARGLRGGLNAIIDQQVPPFGQRSHRSEKQGLKMATDFLGVLDQFPELQDIPVIVTEMVPRAAYTGFTDALIRLAKGRSNVIPVAIHYEPADYYRYDLHLTTHGNRTAAAQLAAVLKRVVPTKASTAAAAHPGF